MKGAPSMKIMALVWKLVEGDVRNEGTQGREKKGRRGNFCKEKESINRTYGMTCLRGKLGFQGFLLGMGDG